ncbi:iron-containing alcohol dehydrogenase [Bacillus sp. FJAT-50079]|uniref:iron-containing alcohol dehydrogenase n=1 Tax=Bacillus sp. FJAT-50079 TaxID=2833577 RepID=UPI001BC98096|nr:iron-containing alcohol dehydrogenase [Bacillus sp. FJAT-50079]MBS4207532.1 iron-containing alcohol dehydrogenase [Bacillus sp. FJAT-50079]
MKYQLPVKVKMGETVIEIIGRDVKEYGKKALIVTDKGIVNNGLVEPIIDSLTEYGVQFIIFDEVVSNPTVKNVEDATNVFISNECDVLVAVGGGSPIDTAKAVGVIATNGGKITDYDGFDKFEKDPIPQFNVPTTVGTGSEVSMGAVISDPENKSKLVVASERLYAIASYLDKRMVANLPGPICAATGIDALTHAIEGYVSKNANPFTDGLNLQAIRLIQKHLRGATAGNPDDLYQSLIAASIAGAGFHIAGLGLVHAIANTVGGHFPVHHGVANSIILPHVMKFNLIANFSKFADIAQALGVNTNDLTEREAALQAVVEVENLMSDVGVPTRLRDVGVKEEAIPTIAEEALHAIDRPTNPRKNTVKEIEEITRSAF